MKLNSLHGAVAMAALLTLAACSERDEIRALSLKYLTSDTTPGSPVSYDEFAIPVGAGSATGRFEGRLRLATDRQQTKFDLDFDELELNKLDYPGLDSLPPFDFEFVQHEGYLVPLRRGPVANDHNWWEFVVEPGRVWDEESDGGYSRAAIPFALKERNADCTHNGVITFLYKSDGAISHVAFQISNQTCKYLKFEMWGTVPATYDAYPLAAEAEAKAAFDIELAGRLHHKPISEIAQDYPAVTIGDFGQTDDALQATVSVFGFFVDGQHYRGGCDSPRGSYPYCDQLLVPSYSMAKSLVGGLGLMRAEFLYPGVSDEFVRDWVPQCDDRWDGVTIEHALDMTTGLYDSTEPEADEDAVIVGDFFVSDDHETKVGVACSFYKRKDSPGQRWVYHTTDSYLAGTALNAFVRARNGDEVDFFDDLIVEDLWQPLGLSPAAAVTRRTYDESRQPFTGWGLSFLPDDLVKLAVFLGEQGGRINGETVLDEGMFAAIKAPQPDDAGLTAEYEAMRYNNGFRIRDVSAELNCEKPVWITNLSGYGGINLIIMPNDTAFYAVRDNGEHRYVDAVRASHKVRPMC